MKIKADLHNHLANDNLRKFNRKGFFNKVVDKTREELGAGGILGLGDCIERRYTKFVNSRDMNSYDIEDLENAVYVPEKDILIVRAQEVFAKEGDILVLGLNEKDFIGKVGEVRTRSLEDSIKEAQDCGGIIGIDHGYSIQGSLHYIKNNMKLLDDIDFIEVHNGNIWLTPGANKKAQEFYKEIAGDFPNIGTLCSSDGHRVFEIGLSYSVLNDLDKTNSDTLKESLRKSIRLHKDWSKDKRGNSYIGASLHLMEMIPPMIIEKITGKYPMPKPL